MPPHVQARTDLAEPEAGWHVRWTGPIHTEWYSRCYTVY